MIDPLVPSEMPMPHSLETERAVLGGVLLEPGALDEIGDRLQPADFYAQRHGILFEAMRLMVGAGEPLDVRTLHARLEQEGTARTVGGLAYLTGLDLDLPDLSRLDSYVEIIRDRANRRRLMAACVDTMRKLQGGGAVSDALAPLLGQAEGAMATEAGGEGFVRVVDVLDAYMDRIEEPHSVEGPDTGIQGLDQIIGGLAPGRLALVGGMAGVGKTAILTQMVVRDLLAGRSAGILSLEMSKLDLLNRIMAHGSTVSSRILWAGGASGIQFQKLMQFRHVLVQRPDLLWIDDTARLTLRAIKARVRRLVRKRGARVVYVDFLTLISKDEEEARRRQHEWVTTATYELATLAKEEGISVVCLIQLNRGPANERRVPGLSDLRDGGEQAAWYVILLHRDLAQQVSDDNGDEAYKVPIYGPRGLVILAKHRDGDLGAIRTVYDGQQLQWWDADRHAACGGVRGVLMPTPIQGDLL